MKRPGFLVAVLLCVALTFAGIGGAGYRAAGPSSTQLSKYIPSGPLLYLESKDFSSLLGDWNSSTQKRQWIQSSNYEIFARSRLFLRLKAASDQFAAAAGLPPDMNFLSQVSGEHSVLAVYDIGNLQFLYITYLPAAKSMETTLWQTRAKFEPRSSGGMDFYLRRDADSKREVAFAVSGDYLLLATREDLMAGALLLMSGRAARTIESDQMWGQSANAAGPAGELRMVLDLERLVPNGYFRTYWVQQNITDLSQYSSAVSDLFRSGRQYREERVLIRKKEAVEAPAPDGAAAVAELVRLVPDDVGFYAAVANPTAGACFSALETKLLAPHVGPALPSQMAPQLQLTSGEQGGGSDLETRIDQAPAERPLTQPITSALRGLLEKTPTLAMLQLQSTTRDQAGVFVKIHSAVVLLQASNWDENGVHAALAEFVRPGLTASQLGIGWRQESGFRQLDGLWPLAASVRGKYLLVSDDAAFLQSLLANFKLTSDRKPADLVAAFNHEREGANFALFSGFIDRPNWGTPDSQSAAREPQFFSSNMASLSATLSEVSAEKIEVHNERGKVRQTVTYEWSQ